MILLSVFAVTFLVRCVPPPATEPGSTDAAEETQEKKDYDARTCDRYLSFAYGYYQNQDWRGTIKNYRRMIENDCEEAYAKDIFYYMGRAYRELGTEDETYLDSAAYTYQRGLEYLPSNTALRKNLAYVYRLQGKTDMEIREYEKLAERDPDNIDYYEELVKLYFQADRYEDVTWATEKILELDPGNQQAINDRMLAYQKLGKDLTEVQKEAWEKNPSVTNGLDYASALEEKKEYENAVVVLKKVTTMAPTNYEAWEMLGSLYKTLDDKENVIKTYKHIAEKLSPRDLDIIANIVETQLALTRFEEAYEWAKRAYQINSNSKTSNKLMGDVYYRAAEYYSEEVDFEDKLVYKLAYDYYKKASELGEYSVKSRLDYLKEFRIPSDEDWFMNKYEAGGKDRTDFTPQKECYDWIEESASK